MSAIRQRLQPSIRLAQWMRAKLAGGLRAGAGRRLLAGAVPLLLGGLLAGGSVLLLLARPAGAQGVQTGERSFTNRYARPGRPTMTVYMWGQFGRTGIWKVERNIELIELLSAANVPGLGTDEPETRERYLLRIYRPKAGRRMQIYENKLEEVIQQSAGAPTLQQGDVLVLERKQKQRWSFRRITQYIGTASSLVLLALRLTSL